MTLVKSLGLPLCLCLVASGTLAQDARAQGASIRPLIQLPEAPGHGFYVSTIELVPDNFTDGNTTYTATVIIQVRDLPGFVAKSDPVKLQIKHIKGSETMEQIRATAKTLADAQFDEIIKTLQSYKSDFDKNKQ